MEKYDKLYNEKGHFKGNYWQFAVLSKNLYFMIGLTAFSTICFFETWNSVWPDWYSYLFYIPTAVMFRLNYTHWKERQKGKSS